MMYLLFGSDWIDKLMCFVFNHVFLGVMWYTKFKVKEIIIKYK